MRVFEVYLNNKKLCVAGTGGDGVLAAIIDQVTGKNRNELRLHVGGLVSPTSEHLEWRNLSLKLGDEVRVRIGNSGFATKPRKRWRVNPADDIKAQKRYVREMAKKFGWKVKGRA
jgi:hypothetical protein